MHEGKSARSEKVNHIPLFNHSMIAHKIAPHEKVSTVEKPMLNTSALQTDAYSREIGDVGRIPCPLHHGTLALNQLCGNSGEERQGTAEVAVRAFTVKR